MILKPTKEQIEYFSLMEEDITKNPNFKKWFGNSKVKDRSGNPLVVYHGSNREFDTFTQANTKEASGDYIGEGFYFASKPEISKQYGSKVKDFYLRLLNPIEIHTKGDIEKYYSFISKQFSNKEISKITGQSEEEIEKYKSLVGESYIYFQLKKKEPLLIKKKLESLGYDGLIDTLYGQYAVFKSNQIKSIDNKGTFSLGSNNIYE